MEVRKSLRPLETGPRIEKAIPMKKSVPQMTLVRERQICKASLVYRNGPRNQMIS
jgi:hypothetical protein